MEEIVILSGKGGTGKTSISAAFATINSANIVADCDVDAANMHLILQPVNYKEEKYTSGYKAVIDYDICSDCGKCLDYCRFDAIERKHGVITISETACDGCKLCMRVCPAEAISMQASDDSRWYEGEYRNGTLVHARLAPGEDNSGKLVSLVRSKAVEIAREQKASFVLIDGPPGTGCPVISSLTGAHKAVIVTEPTRSGFHDLKRILELCDQFKVKTYVLINKADLNSKFSDKVEDWCKFQGIPVLGKIPFEPAFVEAMVQCKSIVELAPESDISQLLKSIYKTIFSAK